LLGKLVPELFQPECCIPLTFSPQKSDHFTKSNQTMPGFGARNRLAYQGAHGFLELLFIGTAAHHEFCKSFSGIQFDKETSLGCGGDVYFAQAQLFTQFLTMCLGGDYDSSVPGLKGRADMLSQGLNQG
jgi:hypothetical protein